MVLGECQRRLGHASDPLLPQGCPALRRWVRVGWQRRAGNGGYRFVLAGCSRLRFGGSVGGLSGEAEITVVKLLRARGGCLGVSRTGVEDCENLGEAVKRALIPRFPIERGELKHLSTRRKGKKLDSLSSGERKGISLNRAACRAGSWGPPHGVTNSSARGTFWKVGP